MRIKNLAKIISLLLVVIILVSASGCGTAQTEISRIVYSREAMYDNDKTATKGFRVGFGRTEILPEDSVPMRGYGDSSDRMSDGYLDRIYITCVAITDEKDNTLLMLSVDLVAADKILTDNIRKYAKDTYGIAEEYVHLTATHTHSAPDIRSDTREILKYLVKFYSRSHEAVDIAMSDRKQAEIYVGETQTQGLNFDRHYWRADGTARGDNYGYFSDAETVSHINDVDGTMRLIKFTRKKSDGKKAKDVVLANWQAHNHLTGGTQQTDISADWSGAFGKELEEKKDCYFAYYQGCAGNINPFSLFEEENQTRDYREYGKKLSDYAIAIYDKMEKMNTGLIKAKNSKFTYASNQQDINLKVEARAIVDQYNIVKNNNAILEMCRPYNIHGIFHARAILNRTTGDTTIAVSAFSIGDIGFTTASVEMFDSFGVTIREKSPFKFTFTISYTDEHNGYMPSKQYYECGSYEAYISKFDKGAGEKCTEQLIKMLNDIHK